MAELCRRAKMATIRRQLESGNDQLVSLADFDSTLTRMSPSVSATDLLEYEKWRREHSPDQGDNDAADPPPPEDSADAGVPAGSTDASNSSNDDENLDE